MADKVFVSGCFDLLHSGHVAFLKTAASFGEVYVGVGRDETVALLKAAGFGGVLSLEWLKRWCLSLAEPGIVFPQYIGYMRELTQ